MKQETEEWRAAEKKQYEKMTETPVSKLIIMLGIPTTISMLVTNIYNMADTYFVGELGTSASGAVGVVFGLMAIIQAFGFMFGHGAGSIISRRLGAKDVESATRFASTSFVSALAAGGLITVLGLLFLEPLMRLLGSTDTILPYAKTYAIFILIAAPFMASSCVMNNILRYEGRAALAIDRADLGKCHQYLRGLVSDDAVSSWGGGSRNLHGGVPAHQFWNPVLYVFKQ